MTKVNTFHIGPQKAATTWLYECFLEHPRVKCASTNNVKYFNMHYHLLNREEYHEMFKPVNDQDVIIDMTQSYLRSVAAPQRIHDYNPSAKIILCLRNPIERAFSHYWHVKKKNQINYDFDDVLEHYDLFDSCIETGYYARHIERYLDYFSREQIFVQKYSGLKEDSEQFLNNALQFLEVNTDFRPSVLDEIVNRAGPKGNVPQLLLHKANKFCAEIMPGIWKKYNITSQVEQFTKNEYKRGIPEQLRQKLLKIYVPEIQRTEQLLNIGLDEWKS